MSIIVGHMCTVFIKQQQPEIVRGIDGFQQVIVASNDQTEHSIIKTCYLLLLFLTFLPCG